MLKEWQFNVLFFVGVGGALFLLIGPEIGFNISQNPTAVAGIGAILSYVLTQKKSITGEKKKNKAKQDKADQDDADERKEVRAKKLEELDKIYGPMLEERWRKEQEEK